MEQITKGKLNRMFKYFKNKKVLIQYHYASSIGIDGVREYKGRYDRFKINEIQMTHGKYYDISLYCKDKRIVEEGFHDHAEFIGLGKIKECNSGPYCYFIIKKRRSFNLKLKL